MVTTRNRAAICLLAAVVTAVAMTACAAGSPEAGRPDTAPVNSTAPTAPTATSSPASANLPPELPQAAQGLTLAAGELFIRHYIDLMNYAAKTGDTTALRAASEPSCAGCAKYFGSVEKVNEQNGGLTGDYSERFVEVTELTRTKEQRLAASTDVTVGRYIARQTASATPVTVAAANYTEEMVLSASNGNWQMFEMELTKR